MNTSPSIAPERTGDIEPGLSMQRLLEVYPGAQRALFRQYHIGGCSACGFQMEETLEQVCQRNDSLPVGEVIAWLEESRLLDARMEITPAALKEALESDPPPRVLDIRTREEWEAARIPGSEFFTQDLLQTAMQDWTREAMLVVVDHLGLRSPDAAAYFQGHGFTRVRSLRGGLDAYSLEADPSIPRYKTE